MKKETRAFDFEVNATENEEHGHFLEGRPIVYDSRTDLGDFDEVIDPGALNETDLRDVRFLVNHDTNKIPLARSRRNNENSTMQLAPDDHGMKIRVDLDTEHNVDAAALYSSVTRGDISGMSFAFTVDDESWEDLESEHPVRHVRKIGRVFEVSACSWPAYEQTELEARSKALESAREDLERSKSEARTAQLWEEIKKLGGAHD